MKLRPLSGFMTIREMKTSNQQRTSIILLNSLQHLVLNILRISNKVLPQRFDNYRPFGRILQSFSLFMKLP
jgi:hypothetical protein